MTEKKKPTLSPRNIHHGAFVSEGRMVAFPTCFPGASIPITADESHITALDVTGEGDVYGGTGGKKTHLFVGMFRGVTGAVFDMGVVEGANQCAAICCGRRRFAAFVNGKDGGRILSRRLQGLPFDLIQEWGFSRPPFAEIGTVGGGERIVHAVPDASRRLAVGTAEKHLFVVDLNEMKINVAGSVKGRGRIAAGMKYFYGLDESETLWRFDAGSRRLERRAVTLPKGAWDQGKIQWTGDPNDGTLYAADDEGRLFAFREETGFTPNLGQTPLAPVTTMAVTRDGRVYGTCGEEMSHFFTCHPVRKELRDLGVALSTIERRRYGYLFGDAAVGRDGEIYFGEDDDLGHLWIYFPSIEAAGRV